MRETSDAFAMFMVVHFEVGGDTRSLEFQQAMWQPAVELVALSEEYGVKLNLQLNPQWAEYILGDRSRLDLLRRWQQQGHEIGLHHHGYDHGGWNGYTNRPGKEDDPRFRGSVHDMMKLMKQLVYPYQISSGTITDEEFDYPQDIEYDTEGIQIYHARGKPKWVTLGGNNRVIQVGMAFLSFEGDIESLKCEYLKSKIDEIFGVVTHEKDFAKNPMIIEKWFKFIKSRGETIKTVSQIIMDYQKAYPIEHNEKPLKFLNDVMGAVR